MKMIIKDIKKSDVTLTVELNQQEIDFIYAVMGSIAGNSDETLRSIADDLYFSLKNHVNIDFNVTNQTKGVISCIKF